MKIGMKVGLAAVKAFSLACAVEAESEVNSTE
jgi:hypothetical protein